MTQKGAAMADEIAWTRTVLDAVRALRFGSVEVIVHDGRVVQIETRNKVRFDVAGRRSPDHGERE